MPRACSDDRIGGESIGGSTFETLKILKMDSYTGLSKIGILYRVSTCAVKNRFSKETPNINYQIEWCKKLSEVVLNEHVVQPLETASHDRGR